MLLPKFLSRKNLSRKYRSIFGLKNRSCDRRQITLELQNSRLSIFYYCQSCRISLTEITEYVLFNLQILYHTCSITSIVVPSRIHRLIQRPERGVAVMALGMYPYVIHVVCFLLKYSLMRRVFLCAGEIVKPTYVCVSVLIVRR